MDTVRAITIDGKPYLVYGDMPPVAANDMTTSYLWESLRRFAANQSGNVGVVIALLFAIAAVAKLCTPEFFTKLVGG